MDSELVTGVVALLTAALSLWQEYRHRKEKKKAPPTLAEAQASGPMAIERRTPRPKVRK